MPRIRGPAGRRAPVINGKYLRAARLARGWTQKQEAEKAGISQAAVSHVELGRNTNSQHILLIKHALGLPINSEAREMIEDAKRARQREAMAAQAGPAPVVEAALASEASGQRGNSYEVRAHSASEDARERAGDTRPEPGSSARAGTDGDTPGDAAAMAASAAKAAAEADAIRRGRLVADFGFFAGEKLRIRSKAGPTVPLAFNRAQQHIHAALEAQKAATGKVRALILKGRQQGCSTYVGGRYYHRATHERGLKVFILTHAEQATENLFEMVERFHQHWAEAPRTSVANAREMHFDELELRLQGRHRGHPRGRTLVDRAAVPRLRGGALAVRGDARGGRAAGGALGGGHRGDPGIDRPRHRQCLPPDVARRRDRRERLHRGVRAVVLAGRLPQAGAGRIRARRPRSTATPRSTGSTSSRWRGAGARSPSSRTRACSRRNTRRPPPRRSRCPATTASSRPSWSPAPARRPAKPPARW